MDSLSKLKEVDKSAKKAQALAQEAREKEKEKNKEKLKDQEEEERLAAIETSVKSGHVANCVSELEKSFGKVKFIDIRHAIAASLPENPNPGSFVLDLVKTFDKLPKNSRPFTKLFLDAFSHSLAAEKIKISQQHVEQAMAMTEQVQPATLISICDAFKLTEKYEDQTIFVRISEALLKQGSYKDAITYIVRFQLQKHFDSETLLRPMLQQLQHAVAATYVKDTPGTEELFITLLEEVVKNSLPLWLLKYNEGIIVTERGPDFDESLTSTHRASSSLPRDFLKCAAKYAESFSVDLTEEKFPCICQASDLAALKWLMISRDRQRNSDLTKGRQVDTANWDSLIDVLLEGHPALQLYYTRKVREMRDFDSCQQAATRFEIRDEWYMGVVPSEPEPPPVKPAHPSFGTSSKKEKPVYCRPNDVKVTFVDTNEKLLACMEEIKSVPVVGIDCEWRPSIGRFRHSKLALLQMAADGMVFLIDLHALTTHEVAPFFSFLFSAEEIVKLGYQFDSDMKQLGRTYPGIKALLQLKSYIELGDIDTQIMRKFKRKRSPLEKGGLSGLARKYLKKTLDKRMQVSDWARRPLTPSQFEYSASDAYVLIDLYQQMMNVHSELEENPNLGWRDVFSDLEDADDDEEEDDVGEEESSELTKSDDTPSGSRDFPPGEDGGGSGSGASSSSSANLDKGKGKGADSKKEREDRRGDDERGDSKRQKQETYEKKLVRQVAYYLSQKSLSKNEYFRKSMDGEGFVESSILLLMNKVKTLNEGKTEEEALAVLRTSPTFEFSKDLASLRLSNPDDGVVYIPWEFKKNLAFSVGANHRPAPPSAPAPASVNDEGESDDDNDFPSSSEAEFVPRPSKKGPPKAPGELSVLVDSMMGKLGKKLRCCGVDTVIVAQHQQAEIVENAQKSGRIVLTRGRGYTLMRGKLSPSQIFDVTEREVAKQLLQVLTHFHVKVRKSDLFSRCPVCNENSFIPRTAEEIRAKHNLGGVPIGVVEQVTEFFECSGCTKMYWEGIHIGSAMEGFFGFLMEHAQTRAETELLDEKEEDPSGTHRNAEGRNIQVKVGPYTRKKVIVSSEGEVESSSALVKDQGRLGRDGGLWFCLLHLFFFGLMASSRSSPVSLMRN